MEIAADQETTAISKKITSKSSQISSKVIASEQLKNPYNQKTGWTPPPSIDFNIIGT